MKALQTEIMAVVANDVLTLGDWVEARGAEGLALLTAVRLMLADVEAGHVALLEREVFGLPLH